MQDKQKDMSIGQRLKIGSDEYEDIDEVAACCLSVCLSVICLSICLSVNASVCIPVRLHFSLSVRVHAPTSNVTVD